MEQFIARKADILFCPAWKTATLQEEEHEEEEAAGLCWFHHIKLSFTYENNKVHPH